MAIPLLAKLAALGGAGTALVMDNKKEREKIKKMVEEDKEKNKRETEAEKKRETRGMKKGGAVKAKNKGDGICKKGHTKGRMV